MKSINICVSLWLLLAVFLIKLANAYPLEDTDLFAQPNSAALEGLPDAEADNSSSYDDEIVSHVVEIVNLALDALQP